MMIFYRWNIFRRNDHHDRKIILQLNGSRTRGPGGPGGQDEGQPQQGARSVNQGPLGQKGWQDWHAVPYRGQQHQQFGVSSTSKLSF